MSKKKIVSAGLTALMLGTQVAPVVAAKDVKAPVVGLTATKDGGKVTLNEGATVTVSYLKAGKVVANAFANKKLAKGTFSWAKKIGAGSWTVKVTAKDAAGNTAVKTLAVTVAAPKPVVKTEVSAATATVAGDVATINFTLNQAAKAKVEVYLFGTIPAVVADGDFVAGANKVTWNIDKAIADGDYTVKVKAGESVAETKVTVKRVVAPAVEILNAKQIKVNFGVVVDKTTAENEANYSIKAAGAGAVALDPTAVTGDSAKLSEDKKSVTITLKDALNGAWGFVKNDSFLFTVSGVKDEAGVVIADKTATLVFNDATAPAISTVTAKAATNTNKVTVAFTEPVDITTGIFKVKDEVATVAAGSKANEVVLTTASNLVAGTAYTLTINNLKDVAGNLINPNPTSQSFTVTKDDAALPLANVTVDGDDTITAEFGEKMDATSVTVNTIKILDANGVALTPTTDYTVAVKSGDTTGKFFTIKVTNTGIFNSSGVANLSVVFTTSIKDEVGNALAAATKAVTLNKDTVKPTVSSVTFVKPGATYNGAVQTNGAFVVTLSEAVKALAGNNLTRSNIVVIDQNGTDITNNIFNVNPIANVVLTTSNKAIVVVPLAVAPATTVDTVTVRLAADTFVDDANGANGSEAKVVTGVAVKNATGTAVDTTKPALANATGNVGNYIRYEITETDLDTATVLNLDNYRLDGAPLPAGTWITIAPGTPNVVIVNLPTQAVTKTQSYAFTVSGIKDKSGNVANTLAVNNISLTDDIKPVLNAGKLNTDGSITLTFSEAVTGSAASDYEVKVNGVVVTDASLNLANIASGADIGGQLVTIDVAYSAGTGSAGDEVIFIDQNGNTTYDAGTDIAIATGTYANLAAYNAAGILKAADVVTLSVATKATGTLTGADATGNKLANDKKVTVK